MIAIIKRDLKSFITSVRGWTIIWIAAAVFGVFYKNFIVTFFEMQRKASAFGGDLLSVEQLLAAVFNNFLLILTLIVPAITMSLFAEERQSGSIKLLLSSPFPAYQIVVAKFLAGIASFGVLLLATIPFVVFLLTHGVMDIGVVFSSYLGLMLYGSMQIALGLVVSLLTASVLLAYACSSILLLLLLVLNWLLPSLTSGGAWVDILRFVAPSTHLDRNFKGLWMVSDFLFYLGLTGMLVFMAAVAFESLKNK
jgi:ABC-2 type transport system permease protein